MKKPTKFGWIFLALVLLAFALTSFGIWKICNVTAHMNDGIKEARSFLSKAKSSAQKSGNGNNITLIGRKSHVGEGIGILTFHLKKDTEVGVFEGATDSTLEKGAGRYTTSALINAPGNCVLYGHRDSAFRPVKELKVGNKLTLQSSTTRVTYRIAQIKICGPDDALIFADSDKMRLTLVTCYPFSFVGPAPQRCVIIAYPE